MRARSTAAVFSIALLGLGLLGAVLPISACSEEGHLFVNGPLAADGSANEDGGGNQNGDGGGNQNGDGGLVDLGPDMTILGPSCGQIVTCVLQCGLTNFSCSQGCLSGVQTDQLAAAGALVLCASTNCLFTDAGGGGQFGILTCMATACSQEVADCGGLIPGGFGGFGGP